MTMARRPIDDQNVYDAKCVQVSTGSEIPSGSMKT
jgi:hypothetical protein